jgi:hypothetical protein
MSYTQISEEVIADAAFVAGLLSGSTRAGLIPIPVRIDGLETIAFCIKAAPASDPSRIILHPIFIIPHEGMLIQDRRSGASKPLSRVTVMPMDIRHSRYYQAALADPEAFFSNADWGK